VNSSPIYNVEKQKKFIDAEYDRVVKNFNKEEWHEHRTLIFSMKMLLDDLETKLKAMEEEITVLKNACSEALEDNIKIVSSLEKIKVDLKSGLRFLNER